MYAAARQLQRDIPKYLCICAGSLIMHRWEMFLFWIEQHFWRFLWTDFAPKSDCFLLAVLTLMGLMFRQNGFYWWSYSFLFMRRTRKSPTFKKEMAEKSDVNPLDVSVASNTDTLNQALQSWSDCNCFPLRNYHPSRSYQNITATTTENCLRKVEDELYPYPVRWFGTTQLSAWTSFTHPAWAQRLTTKDRYGWVFRKSEAKVFLRPTLQNWYLKADHLIILQVIPFAPCQANNQSSTLRFRHFFARTGNSNDLN